MTNDNHSIKTAADGDTLVGVPGGQPVATGLGAVLVGAATGAVGGSIAGPLGAIIGAAAGGVAGALGGDAIGNAIDEIPGSPDRRTDADPLDRMEHGHNGYMGSDLHSGIENYGPAYAFGIDSYRRHRGRSFESAEPELAREWVAFRGPSPLSWDRAKPAIRDAWTRIRGAL